MNTQTEFNERFLQHLHRLNPGQLAAVQQTEGPVLVLAGPGTGKTQVLATRIGNILRTTDARPQNILCLTFTDAGVLAMRERLLALIGPDAHRVPVMTYHAFCNRVIQENAAEFGDRPPQTLSELERIGLIRTLLDELPATHPLRLGYKSQYQLEGALGRLFSQMKSSGWKPGDIHRAIDSWIRDLPNQEAFVYKKDTEHGKKGSLKSALVKAEMERMERLRTAADLFPNYNHALKKADRYEFEDMLLWTIRVFQKQEDVLRTYQERYQYVLVDEYQDTNGAQNQLLSLLLSYWEQPNIFAVGDDDQSVYEFQGARLHNLIDFFTTYKEGLEVIVLQENYRSAQAILDAAHCVIENNELRSVRKLPISVEKKLISRVPQSKVDLAKKRYPTRISEDHALVERLQTLLKTQVPASQIAIICAKHKQFDRIMPLLDRAGIPYQAKRPLNLLQTPLVRQIREILQYIAAEQRLPFTGDPMLFKLLHAGYFEIAPTALALFAVRQNTSETPWRVAVMNENWPYAHALVRLPEQVHLFLPELMEKVLHDLNVLAYLLQLKGPAGPLEVLNSWQEFVRETAASNPGLLLDQFLELLDRMEANTVAIPFLQTIRMENGVQLLTAHSSKGLEFDHVLLPDCTTDAWEPSSRGFMGQFVLPPTLTFTYGEEDALEARRRLFFVAMTRAKKGLYLSFADKNYNGKSTVACRFWEETGISEELAEPDLGMKEAAVVLALSAPASPVLLLPDPEVVAGFLQQFSMSARALNKYLRCKIAFYYEEVLSVPITPSAGSMTGSAIHTALQTYFVRMQKSGGLPDKQELLDLFTNEMNKVRVFFGVQNFEQRLANGLYALEQYWITQVPYWRKRAKLELAVRNVELDGVRLVGAIDKVEIAEDGSAKIVDYKTGTYLAKRVSPPDDVQPFGGDYYRQILFYKVLLEESQLLNGPVKGGLIDWVEPDRKGTFHKSEIAFSTNADSWMRDLIQNTAQDIQNSVFGPGCGLPECTWCTLQKERLLESPVWQPESDLDDRTK